MVWNKHAKRYFTPSQFNQRMKNPTRCEVESSLGYYEPLEQIRLIKCNMIDEGFVTTHNRTRYQDELIHEHQLISARLKEQTLGICCTTCGNVAITATMMIEITMIDPCSM
jgi:hypothetical protein